MDNQLPDFDKFQLFSETICLNIQNTDTESFEIWSFGVYKCPKCNSYFRLIHLERSGLSTSDSDPESCSCCDHVIGRLYSAGYISKSVFHEGNPTLIKIDRGDDIGSIGRDGPNLFDLMMQDQKTI